VFHNFKGFISIILLALVDTDYKFLWMDVGANGSMSDCVVFNQLEFMTELENGILGLLPPTTLPGDNTPLHNIELGDNVFPMRQWLMKPYSCRNMTNNEKIFNYRLSQARRVIKNESGIHANRFRYLLTTMHQTLDNVKHLLLALLCLHNLMRIRYPGVQNDVANRVVSCLVSGEWSKSYRR